MHQQQLGDVLLLRPGDKIPLDGTVESGTSEVNEAPMTGESLPVPKASGDAVYAGTINGHGALDVVVTARVRDTRLARVIHLVETAQATRAPLQTFVERFAAVYTPVVVLLAVAIATVPWLVGAAAPALWVYRALVLLVIACPCALVVSTPVSFVAALSAAEAGEVMRLTQDAERALTEAYEPQGINVGVNLGRAAGAGIVHHVHVHLVPRWNGDTNFMSVVGDVRVLPEDLAQTARRLRPVFERLKSEWT